MNATTTKLDCRNDARECGAGTIEIYEVTTEWGEKFLVACDEKARYFLPDQPHSGYGVKPSEHPEFRLVGNGIISRTYDDNSGVAMCEVEMNG